VCNRHTVTCHCVSLAQRESQREGGGGGGGRGAAPKANLKLHCSSSSSTGTMSNGNLASPLSACTHSHTSRDSSVYKKWAKRIVYVCGLDWVSDGLISRERGGKCCEFETLTRGAHQPRLLALLTHIFHMQQHKHTSG
jgi:hypothetical protein